MLGDVVVDPKLLKAFARLAVEIAQDEAALAKKRVQYRRLEAMILNLEEGNPLPQMGLLKEDGSVEVSKSHPLPWEPDDLRPSQAIAEAVEAVAALGGEASTKNVAVKLGISGSAASIRLTRAVEAGLLRKVAFGTYGLPKPVPEPPP